MKLRPLGILAAGVGAAVVIGLAGCEDESSTATPFDAGTLPDVVIDTSTPPPSPVDAGADAFDASDACVPGPPLTLLDGGGLAPTPYRQASDSPFYCRPFGRYFHLENFETGKIATPGLVAPVGRATFPTFATTSVDSVDGDDGKLADGGQGACTNCNSWIHLAEVGITFVFDEAILGELPSHVGLVWTDGAENVDVTFQAFDAAGTLITEVTQTGMGDDSQLGTAEEDRFFGVVDPRGIKRIHIRHVAPPNAPSGIEVDHVQYGR